MGFGPPHPQFIKFSNSEVKNAHDSGILGFADSIFTNINIHHNGTTDFDHGLYMAGANNIVENSPIHHNYGWGVHVYNYPGGVNNNIIRGNVVYSNGQSNKRGVGIILSSGDNNQAYNNIIYGNLHGGIQVNWSSNAKVYNNTIYNEAGCITIDPEACQSIVRNNLCSNAGSISNSGTNTTLSNNLTGVNSNVFVDASAQNFQLQAGSSPINAGFNLSSEGIVTDFGGVARPQGAAYDIGAYEF